MTKEDKPKVLTSLEQFQNLVDGLAPEILSDRGGRLTRKEGAEVDRLGWELAEHARTGRRPEAGAWDKEVARRKSASGERQI
jgi:hypothetical protein